MTDQQVLPNGLLTIVALSSVSASLVLATASNYGGDNDTYGILKSFLSVLELGAYQPSRFTGYPVAEIGIGFLAWIGGSALSNATTYFLFLISVLLFPFCLRCRISTLQYLAFLALSLTSTSLVFDSILSNDYPWALFFWVLGCLSLRRFSNRALSIVLMGLSISSRPSFALFVLIAVMICEWEARDESAPAIRCFISMMSTLLASLFVGSLFFLPMWFNYSFGLSWIKALPPDDQGLVGIIARLIYKTLTTIGLGQALVLFICLVIAKSPRYYYRKLLADHHDNPKTKSDIFFLSAIMLANLAIFLRMPIEPSYLQPFILCLYLFIVLVKPQRLATLIASLLIALNIFSWFWQVEVLSITYRSSEMCDATNAEGARIKPSISTGRIFTFFNEQQKAKCYSSWFSDIGGHDYSQAALRGLPLRIK